MDRRRFLALSAGTAALAAFSPRLLADTASLPSDISALYTRSLVIDTLCAPFATDGYPPSHDALQQLRTSGFTAIHTTISERTYEDTINNLARIHSLVERYPDLFTLVRLHSDIQRAKHDRKIGILPGFQYTQFFETDTSRLEVFRDLGVRIMQLTYNLGTLSGMDASSPATPG